MAASASGAHLRPSLTTLLRQLPSSAPRRLPTPDGVGVAVQDWGQAMPAASAASLRRSVVMLHGYAQSHCCWLHQLTSSLAREFHLVSYDLRGHGDSDKPLQPEYYKEARRWADELRAVIEDRALHKPILMAWSYAGRVVLDYLSVHGQEALGGLIMVSASSSVEPHLMGSVAPLLEEMSWRIRCCASRRRASC